VNSANLSKDPQENFTIMEQVNVNQASQVFPTVPAGYCTLSVAGAAGDRVLTADQAACDFIELTGAISGNITVTLPAQTIPQVEGGQNSFTTLPTWLKYFGNKTTGAFTVTIRSATGAGSLLAGNGSNTYGWRAFNGTDVVGATAG
jgi:hypothetical protein